MRTCVESEPRRVSNRSHRETSRHRHAPALALLAALASGCGRDAQTTSTSSAPSASAEDPLEPRIETQVLNRYRLEDMYRRMEAARAWAASANPPMKAPGFGPFPSPSALGGRHGIDVEWYVRHECGVVVTPRVEVLEKSIRLDGSVPAGQERDCEVTVLKTSIRGLRGRRYRIRGRDLDFTVELHGP
jgi:hypothetical protein